MPLLTITEAAHLAQVDRATIRRKLHSWVLSTARAPDGRKGIDLVELARIYPVAAQGAPMSGKGQLSHDASPTIGAGAQSEKVAFLERENELLRQELETAKQREVWFQGQLEQVTQRLLPPPKKPLLEKVAEAWGRFRRQ
jgi:hypothetical protein